MRRPNSSRIRSLRPLPVTAPMRAHISCTTIRAMVIGIMVHEQDVAELRAGLRIGQDAAGIVVDIRGDEARAYDGEEQQEPDLPASQEFHGRRPQRRSNWQNRTIRINAESGVWIGESAKLKSFLRRDEACRALLGGRASPVSTENYLQLGAQHGDHVVGGDHACEVTVLVDHRQSQQVVFVEQFGEFLFFGVFVAGNQRLLGQGRAAESRQAPERSSPAAPRRPGCRGNRSDKWCSCFPCGLRKCAWPRSRRGRWPLPAAQCIRWSCGRRRYFP